MNKEALEALAREAAKSIKTEVDLNKFFRNGRNPNLYRPV